MDSKWKCDLDCGQWFNDDIDAREIESVKENGLMENGSRKLSFGTRLGMTLGV